MKKSMLITIHIAYWSLYLFLVGLIFACANLDKPSLGQHTRGLEFIYSPFFFGAILPAIFGFYSAQKLFNLQLTKKKMPNPALLGIPISLASALLAELILYIAFAGKRINWELNTIIFMGLFLATIAFANGTTGFVLQGFITWFKDIKVKSELNKKNYDMELALIKSQINPHFLFNTINNIDTLITTEPTNASAYLNKLSDIMRYMLYETKTETISLSKELDYINKFIELQKIRTSNPHYINYTTTGNSDNHTIPPMLFIAFIENAFKHTENKKTENAINIHIAIDPHKITFTCDNAYNPNSKNNQDPDRIGLGSELIKKRLSLQYPNRHTLITTESNNTYKVSLTLTT
jgi:two-component system, LytTR family, sensor kinase